MHSQPTPAIEPVESARSFAVLAARLAANTRCYNVVVLDVRHISPVTDFFVIATGTSPRQMQSVCDDIEEMAQPLGHKPISRAGHGSDIWILLDFVDVIIHVFSEGARQFYDLEYLWGDAKRLDWEDAKTERPSPGASTP
jgi:ribosome-associated protein